MQQLTKRAPCRARSPTMSAPRSTIRLEDRRQQPQRHTCKDRADRRPAGRREGVPGHHRNLRATDHGVNEVVLSRSAKGPLHGDISAHLASRGVRRRGSLPVAEVPASPEPHRSQRLCVQGALVGTVHTSCPLAAVRGTGPDCWWTPPPHRSQGRPHPRLSCSPWQESRCESIPRSPLAALRIHGTAARARPRDGAGRRRGLRFRCGRAVEGGPRGR